MEGAIWSNQQYILTAYINCAEVTALAVAPSIIIYLIFLDHCEKHLRIRDSFLDHNSV